MTDADALRKWETEARERAAQIRSAMTDIMDFGCRAHLRILLREADDAIRKMEKRLGDRWGTVCSWHDKQLINCPPRPMYLCASKGYKLVPNVTADDIIAEIRLMQLKDRKVIDNEQA